MKAPVEIDAARLWARLMELGEIGAIPGGGVNRQALSDGEHLAWRKVIGWARAAGMEAATDAAANLFLILPGRDRGLAPVMAGSHLDSQPTGGRFDGAFGVMAALETAVSLAASPATRMRDFIAVAWMNEEGSRFAPGMMGSEVFAGKRDIAAVRATGDADGILAGDEIDRLHRAFPDLPMRMPFRPRAFLEPHIEQAPRLEREGATIGVVSGIDGKVTCEVILTGERNHAGTQPMSDRRDAVMAFARVALRLQEEIGLADPGARFTIGRVEVSPNAPSVIAGEVRFRIDLRHDDGDLLRRLAAQIAPLAEHAAAPCAAELRVLVDAAPNGFDPALRAAIETSAARRGFPALTLASAAGHDARHLAEICPTAMIFVPCRDGISHDPAEWAEPDHVAAGTQALADVVVPLIADASDIDQGRP